METILAGEGGQSVNSLSGFFVGVAVLMVLAAFWLLVSATEVVLRIAELRRSARRDRAVFGETVRRWRR
jgi:hypothetical protein